MPSLATAMLSLARILTHVHTGLTTGAGSTSTIVDTNLTEPVDHFNGGLLFIQSGTYAGKVLTITDYDKSTGTITFSPALAGAPGAGVNYDAFGMEYPKGQLINAINQALAEHDYLPAENTTLVGVLGQSDYTLPAGVTSLIRVEIARSTAAPYYFGESLHWDELPGGVLRFGNGHLPPADMPIRVTYRVPFAFIDDPEVDVVSPAINPVWLQWAAAVYALRNRMREEGRDNSTLAERINEAKTEENKWHSQSMLRPMRRAPRWSDIG